MNNKMELKFAATLENESLARMAVATFLASVNPTLEQLGEIKTIVSEAVSNAIIHGYHFDDTKEVILRCELEGSRLSLQVVDFGVGIEDIEKAKRPHYSSRPDLERAGMGLTIMETLSDTFQIKSVVGMGSKVMISKDFSRDPIANAHIV